MTIQFQRVQNTPMALSLQVRDHVLRVDAPALEGGGDSGPDPHDLYDAALGACKTLTVLWYARHKGWVIDDVQTSVVRDASAERSGTYRLTVRMRIQAALSEAQWAELERAAGKCPVHKLMTQVTTDIATEVERLVV